MTKTNKNTLKNLWKKPLAALLGLSILASMSSTCFAEEKYEQVVTKHENLIVSQNTTTEVDESSDKKSATPKPENICSQMIDYLRSPERHKKLGLTKEEVRVVNQVSLRMAKRLNEHLINNDIQDIGGYECLSLFNKLYKEQQKNLSEQDKKHFESYEKKQDPLDRTMISLEQMQRSVNQFNINGGH